MIYFIYCFSMLILIFTLNLIRISISLDEEINVRMMLLTIFQEIFEVIIVIQLAF